MDGKGAPTPQRAANPSLDLAERTGQLDDLPDNLMTVEQREEYLRYLRDNWDKPSVVHDAASHVGVSDHVPRLERERDPAFKLNCHVAMRVRQNVMIQADWKIKPKIFKLSQDGRKDLPFTEEDWLAFLEHLAKSGRFTESAHAIGRMASTIRHVVDRDPVFKALCDEAMQIYAESLENTAHRRAVEGWDEPVFGGREKDQLVGYVRKYSDRLLELMLKKRDPGYRDKVQVEQQQTVTVKHQVDFSALNQDQRAKLRELLALGQGQGSGGSQVLPEGQQDAVVPAILDATAIEKKEDK